MKNGMPKKAVPFFARKDQGNPDCSAKRADRCIGGKLTREPWYERILYAVGTALFCVVLIPWCIFAGLFLAWDDARQARIDKQHGEGEGDE